MNDVPIPSAESAAAVRAGLVDLLRRDLIGPGLDDADLAREVLKASENPSRWYLTGFLAPSPEGKADAAAEPEEEGNPVFGPALDNDEGGDPETGRARAPDDAPADEPVAHPRRFPSSLGLTVLLDAAVDAVEVTLTWGDYVTEPPLPPEILTSDTARFDPQYRDVRWRRIPGHARMRLRVPDGRGPPVTVPDSGGRQRPSGALVLEAHARPYDIREPDGSVRKVRALTVMAVNRRSPVRRGFADVTFAFRVRLELRSKSGLYPRCDLSGVNASDADTALADLHFRDVAEYAVGRGTSAGWQADADGVVRAAHTDHLPSAEVERVEPNQSIAGVEFGMEALASLAAGEPGPLQDALAGLPKGFAAWIAQQTASIPDIAGASRQATAKRLVEAASRASARIAGGIALLAANPEARRAFQAMNEAVARAARRRNAGPDGNPAAQPNPRWRPFQLAFILLNLRGPRGAGASGSRGRGFAVLPDRRRQDRSLSGPRRLDHRLAAADQFRPARRRRIGADALHAAAADARSTLPRRRCRLRAGTDARRAGLAAGGPPAARRLADRDRAMDRLGGLAEPAGQERRWPRRYRSHPRSPLPPRWPRSARADQGLPLVRHAVRQGSFACELSDIAPRNMVIRCVNAACDFTRDRALPVLTVDEAIYRRLPAFLIATADKFASLPWLGEVGAFFGHVDRHDEWGFYGAAQPGAGKRLWNGHALLPPDLIIQDELHLISGPLGTVAALYEVALDRLASRDVMGKRIRPKIVASTATVRRATAQVRALFDRAETEIFPPPGPDRRDAYFAVTVPPERIPERLYVGLASPGCGPKLIFLRVLTTLLSAARAAANTGADADAYETALCYFNALRELGGAGRIGAWEQGRRAQGMRGDRADFGTRVSVEYIMAHSLAHALMTQVALDCGYPASALKERIYVPKRSPDEPARAGILIYTATAGTQGTLGGLVEVTHRFPRVVANALDRLLLCSSDPVCADHNPAEADDERALNGAACHGCLLVSETSCEARNLHLDRALLVETVGVPDAAFFA